MLVTKIKKKLIENNKKKVEKKYLKYNMHRTRLNLYLNSTFFVNT